MFAGLRQVLSRLAYNNILVLPENTIIFPSNIVLGTFSSLLYQRNNALMRTAFVFLFVSDLFGFYSTIIITYII